MSRKRLRKEKCSEQHRKMTMFTVKQLRCPVFVCCISALTSELLVELRQLSITIAMHELSITSLQKSDAVDSSGICVAMYSAFSC